MLDAGPSGSARMIRSFLAVVIGIVVAVLVVAGVEGAGGYVYPKPAGIDLHDMEQVRAYVATMPLGAKGIVVAAWLLGAFLGGLATILVARHRTRLALVPGVAIAAATVANAVLLPHPMWMPVLGVLGAIPMAWLGARLGVYIVTPKPTGGGAWTGGTR
jgi:hypothetical protein